MIRRPAAATSIGFGAGAVVALFPNEFARSALVECIVILVFGGIGVLFARGFKRSPADSRVLGVVVTVTTSAVLVWLWWQNELRAASGQGAVSVGAAAAVWSVAVVTPVVLAAPTLRKVALIAVAVVLGASGISGVAGAQPQAAPSAVFAGIESGAPGLRVYEPLTGEPLTTRADRAVGRLVAGGGLDVRAIVVAVPTGSGWVDARFVRSAEEEFDGHVAILAVQYTQMRSWMAYLFERSTVERASATIVEALDRQIPPDHPPVYFYGQSLGAIGVTAAVRRAREVGFPVAGSLLVGPPGGLGDQVSTSLFNSSDPVVTWSPALLVKPPAGPVGCVLDGGRSPRPPWLPVVSFLQTTVDLLLATDNPPGFGHRYDERQGPALLVPSGCGQSGQKLP